MSEPKRPNLAIRPLPIGWAWCKVNEAGQVQLGRQRAPEHHSGDNMRPYLRVANVYEARIDTRDVLEMNFTPKEVERYELRDGDILLNEGQSRELVGRPAIYRGEVPGACFQNTLVRFTSSGYVLPEFALAVFRHYLHSGVFQAIASWTTNIAHLGAGRFAELDFPLAPLPEQLRICAWIDSYFSRLDAAVEGLKRVQANLKRYRASVLKAAVEGRLVPTEAGLAKAEGCTFEPASELLARILKERRARWEAAELASMKAKGKPPKDDKWKAKYKEPAAPDTKGLPELPEGWCWATVDQLVAEERYALAIGPFGSNLKVSDYLGDGVPLVFVRHIRAQTFVGLDAKFISAQKAAELVAHRVRQEDVLITKMGEPPGEATVYPPGRPDAIITADCIKMTPHRFLSGPGFIVTAIRSPPVQSQIAEITKGVAQKKVSLSRFKSICLPLAPASEQVRIEAEIERSGSIVTAATVLAQRSARRLMRLRQSILRWAFEGKLVDQDPNDEPASVLLERIRAEREGPRRVESASPKKSKEPLAASASRKPRPRGKVSAA